MKRILLGLSMALCCFSTSAQEVSYADISSLTKNVTRKMVSVHDPSVVHIEGDEYYIIGSHRGIAKSTDHMRNWTSTKETFAKVKTDGNVEQVSTDGWDWDHAQAETNLRAVFAKQRVTKVPKGGQEVTFGNYDASAWCRAIPGYDKEAQKDVAWEIWGNMWAPDVIWNPTMNKWCQYLSLNGNAWNSVIVLLTADKVTGPWVYEGPIVFSGFRSSTDERVSWKKTDLEFVIGEQPTLPARYNHPLNADQAWGKTWGDWWPNNIDPSVFYDEQGELWMIYGSWSGGIWMLKLNKANGLRDYDVTYASTGYSENNRNVTSDPYFGKKIAGGAYVSGEGPYIRHIGQFYYLFMSYGGFAPNGGYEMRVFRSENPDGPYVDGNGTSAIFEGYVLNYGPGSKTDTRGMKLLGAFNDWGYQTVGECAQGHNSAIVDDEGRAFVIFHTKFNDGSSGHLVRTHQLYVNTDGWLCAAPFQFDGEQETDASLANSCNFTKDELPGTYDLLIHKYRMNHENMEEVKPVSVTLTADGKVTGSQTGTWTLTNGTGHIALTIGGVTYNGVAVEQTVDGTSQKAIALTATAKSGVSLWAYRLTPKTAVALTSKQYSIPVRDQQTYDKHYPLYGDGVGGTTITWTSSNPEIISNTGLYNPSDTDTDVALTLRMENGSYYIQRQYNVTAKAATTPQGDYLGGLVAYYDFDTANPVNHYNNEEHAILLSTGSGKKPVLEENPGRLGKVYHQFFAARTAASTSGSYARFPNPLKDQELTGFTVSLWLQRANENLWDDIWSFTDKVGYLSAVSHRLFLTGNGYVGYSNGTDWIDFNKPDNDYTTKYISVGSWHLVTVTVDAEAGVSIYVDGTLKNRFMSSFTCATSAGTAASSTATAKLFDYSKIMESVSAATYFQLGVGSFWGSAEALMDDLLIYNRALSADDIEALTTMANRITAFNTGEGGDAIQQVRTQAVPASEGIFDLTGRHFPAGQNLKSGFYIVNGRKTFVK